MDKAIWKEMSTNLRTSFLLFVSLSSRREMSLTPPFGMVYLMSLPFFPRMIELFLMLFSASIVKYSSFIHIWEYVPRTCLIYYLKHKELVMSIPFSVCVVLVLYLQEVISWLFFHSPLLLIN